MKKNLEHIRHSLAHLLAAAALEKFPKAKLGIGPAIENGFYYDFKFPHPLTPKDLRKLKKTMRELIKRRLTFVGKKVTPVEARKLFKNQPFKLDLIKEFVKEKKQLKAYKTGDAFIDLCRGGHVKNAGEIDPDAFMLDRIAGAYWRGDEKKPMLTRIYGLAFNTKKELDAHLKMRGEAEKRDHRKLGKSLDLFIFAEEVGSGLPLFTEKGATVRRELEHFIIEEEIKRGYHHVYTPDIARVKLYEISGHYPYFKDSMYPVMQVDEDKLVLRPMSCPHHFMLYKNRPKSYKELPLKIAEVAKLYRYEKSGELTGLMRVRSFCLADSHIFCRKEQTVNVVKDVIDLINFTAQKLGLTKGKDYWFRLSLGNRANKKKYYDSPKNWVLGERVLRQVLKETKAPYVEAKDEAAFYGPKIDIQMRNINGKEDTAFTVQYDFCLPARFKLEYINEKGKLEQPVVIHRSSIGAIERTMAFLIEHYAGNFPVWLAPIQATVLAVSRKQKRYAEKVCDALKEHGVRVELTSSDETLGKRVRNAELQKIPYILTVGEKEVKAKTVSVRERHKKTTNVLSVEIFLKKLLKEITEKTSR
ncbi:MAG: threonine--tRNA ligase [Patescibacteria group bacterium]|nr:threonine--tRNA ligase [Patescibacteria group bacterium]